MALYVIKRLFQSFCVLLVLSFAAYALMGAMPGDPLDIACSANPHCTPDNLEQMKKNLGLDRPIYERYWTWATNFAKGNLGFSRTYHMPIANILVPRLVNTLILSLLSLVLSFLIAIPLGIFSALKANSKVDYGINVMAFMGISTPSFWLGLMLIMVFSVWLNWLPAGGTSSLEMENMTWASFLWDRARHLILPTLSLSIMTIASWTRYMRASMLETLQFDFMRTAKAKGLSPSRVILFHGLKNAFLPVITVIAVSLGMVFSGAVITETVFAYQGAGYLMFQSIQGNDFNMAMCCFVITCLSVLVMNLLADVCYAYLDPRIKLGAN